MPSMSKTTALSGGASMAAGGWRSGPCQWRCSHLSTVRNPHGENAGSGAEWHGETFGSDLPARSIHTGVVHCRTGSRGVPSPVGRSRISEGGRTAWRGAADEVVRIPGGQRLPPQDLDAERVGARGRCSCPPDAMAEVVETSTPRDFYRSAHGKIYAAVRTCSPTANRWTSSRRLTPFAAAARSKRWAGRPTCGTRRRGSHAGQAPRITRGSSPTRRSAGA